MPDCLELRLSNCRAVLSALILVAFCTARSIGAELPSNQAPAGEAVSFELDIQPILAAQGCNAGACHGKQRGQNGFQLSLLGFDSDFDHDAIARQARGRRLSIPAPESSLLVLKATA